MNYEQRMKDKLSYLLKVNKNQAELIYGLLTEFLDNFAGDDSELKNIILYTPEEIEPKLKSWQLAKLQDYIDNETVSESKTKMNIERRIRMLEKKIGLRESTFTSASQLKQFIIKNANWTSIAGANPQGLPGEVMLEDCNFNDFHFVAENVFSDQLEGHTFSGFSIDFEPFELPSKYSEYGDASDAEFGRFESKLITPEISYPSYDGDMYFTAKSIHIKQFKNEKHEGDYPFNWGFFYLTHVDGVEYDGQEVVKLDKMNKRGISSSDDFEIDLIEAIKNNPLFSRIKNYGFEFNNKYYPGITFSKVIIKKADSIDNEQLDLVYKIQLPLSYFEKGYEAYIFHYGYPFKQKSASPSEYRSLIYDASRKIGVKDGTIEIPTKGRNIEDVVDSILRNILELISKDL